MKISYFVALAALMSTAAIADRGGLHSTKPYVNSQLMRSIEQSGLIVNMTGETNSRHQDITHTICGVDTDGNRVTITGVYKYNPLHYEYRLDKRTVTVGAGC